MSISRVLAILHDEGWTRHELAHAALQRLNANEASSAGFPTAVSDLPERRVQASVRQQKMRITPKPRSGAPSIRPRRERQYHSASLAVGHPGCPRPGARPQSVVRLIPLRTERIYLDCLEETLAFPCLDPDLYPQRQHVSPLLLLRRHASSCRAAPVSRIIGWPFYARGQTGVIGKRR